MESKTINYKIDFINPTAKGNPNWAFVPGFRGVDQMCVYTYDYQLKVENKYSGTNPWGLEASINNQGIVIEVKDCCEILQDGFVLSGNGKAHEFINDYVKPGAKVSLDFQNKTITVEINEIKTGLYTLNAKIELLNKRLKKAINYFYLIDEKKCINLLKRIKSIYKKASLENNLEIFQDYLKQAETIYEELYYRSSKVSLIRSSGLWSRPEEKNLEEIINFLEIMSKNNFNTLYVESFYNGGVAGKSKITNTVKEALGDYGIYKDDYLLALISEAHKRNIEVHAWVENFFVGENISFDKNYPDYFRMVNYDGSTVQGPGGYNTEVPENGFIFLDPAHPDTHKYILSIYEEMLTNYDFDGLNIDYIRYPHGNTKLETSNGYSNYAMEEFKKINNIPLDKDVRELVKDSYYMELWTKYRCSKITLLMKEIRELVDKIKPNCLISMAVVPETEMAIKNKMQDWVPWVKNGWIDITLPMAYYYGSHEVAKATDNLVKFNNNNAFSYTGISPSFQGPLNFNADIQIEAVYENNAQGFAIFQLNNLLMMDNSQQKYLYEGILRVKTIQPHSGSKQVLDAYLNEYNLKFPKIIKKSDKQKAIEFYNKLNDIYLLAKNNQYDYHTILQNLKTLINNLNNYFKNDVYDAIKSDLIYLENILTIQNRIFLKK